MLSALFRPPPVQVFEGESELAAENALIGTLTLRGVRAHPAHQPGDGGEAGMPPGAAVVRVVFDVSADNALTVRAEDAGDAAVATGPVHVTNEGGHLSAEAVQRLAADHAALLAAAA